jgi:GNAT superfamily N-acetyltransferase
MEKSEWSEVAALIYRSTNEWYQTHYGHPIFECPETDLEFFCEVYEALDPGRCFIIKKNNIVAASCFFHERDTHTSLGIMNVNPDFYGRSLGRKVLEHLIDLSDKAGKPLRLVSSAMNLDSFSLYNRYGFLVHQFYQDMLVSVPKEGFTDLPEMKGEVKKATLEDLDEIVDLEMEIHGLNKRKDYTYYMEDKSGAWEVLIHTDDSIKGVLVSVKHPSSNIVGHGVMKNAESAFSLITSSLDRFRGMTPLVLIPSDQEELIKYMYTIKARNCETHVGQVYNPANLDQPKGIVIPSFMPENG